MCFGVVVGCVMSYGCKPWASVDLLTIGALEAASGGTLTIPFGPFILATMPYCIAAIFGYLKKTMHTKLTKRISKDGLLKRNGLEKSKQF